MGAPLPDPSLRSEFPGSRFPARATLELQKKAINRTVGSLFFSWIPGAQLMTIVARERSFLLIVGGNRSRGIGPTRGSKRSGGRK